MSAKSKVTSVLIFFIAYKLPVHVKSFFLPSASIDSPTPANGEVVLFYLEVLLHILYEFI